MNYLLTVSYIGTNYCGWQYQPNARSVQECFQNAVEDLFGKRFPVTGCSRTDSGVHAKGFLCTVKTDGTESPIDSDKLPMALNVRLPQDISVREAEAVPDAFHPRYNTYGKEYRYIFYDGKCRNLFLQNRAWQICHRLDESKMNSAARLFCGKHDFSSFCSVGTSDDNHVRTVFESNVAREGETVVFRVTGNGFLYNMVRIMTGTLYDVSRGKINESDISRALKCGNRASVGMTAPPYGLYLERVLRNPFGE